MVPSRPVTDALRHRRLVVEGPVDRAILHLGAPAALAALLQAGFLVADTFWLGKVGAVAIAAASTAGFVMWLAQALGEGAANGSGAVLANAVGASDEGRAGGRRLPGRVWRSGAPRPSRRRGSRPPTRSSRSWAPPTMSAAPGPGTCG